MQRRLETIKINAEKDAAAADSSAVLQTTRQKYLGKKGELTLMLKELGKLGEEERRTVGRLANEVKDSINQAIELREQELLDEASAIEGAIDLTLPGIRPLSGGLHPITQMCYDLNDAFLSLGFEVFAEDEITSEKYAFDNLNFPPEHPARDTMDTYWIKGTENLTGTQRLCLRPHLTGASVRYLKKHGAPARFVYPGPAYRNESTDARHERAFFQYEALIVDKDFSFASGQLLVKTILEKVFGRKVDVRMRAGFFPFVEPGFEIDMSCLVCGGKGCKVCKNVGWIEVMPGGTPHPNVLKAAGINPNTWSGFYINIGLDRLVMMRYGVDDVRLFRGADLRFLNQFK
ncbi:MAG: phenylalanine--tRNA ligase subunit alpha [Eubacteriales bacterium]|jgi:phenylalanyl-tRNA synthetase alpha chain|nr:phenylalanine--tRNA ligase subunit alpha [Eubacteriales bacterium]MDD4105479.1 phenylalanine--tRNA ligase subunit alpha [Eubacteriales bacterium]